MIGDALAAKPPKIENERSLIAAVFQVGKIDKSTRKMF
jgi:hypothetical protein